MKASMRNAIALANLYAAMEAFDDATGGTCRSPRKGTTWFRFDPAERAIEIRVDGASVAHYRAERAPGIRATAGRGGESCAGLPSGYNGRAT